jgi:two-component system LytT family response regulator
MSYRTLIVDDDQAARDRLRRMLATLNSPCIIINEAVNGFEAISMINEAKPDVVFLDIDLPGINGIELLRHCSYDPFIIFTTAYDSYAIDAFEAKTISYLVKPFSEIGLLAAINKLLKMSRVPVESLASILHPLASLPAAAPLQLLPVKNGDVVSILKIESIVGIVAEGKYSIIKTTDKSYVSNYSISELEERLASPYFIRVNRSWIINLKYVLEIRKASMGKHLLIIKVHFDEEIIVSENRLEELKLRLGME